jgi:hypothetical protein
MLIAVCRSISHIEEYASDILVNYYRGEYSMKVVVLLAVIFTLFSSQANAETLCQQLENSIEPTIKAVAMIKAGGFSDNSAPRETSRQIQVNNELQLISMHLTLLAQNKCPPRSTPVDPSIYMMDALECATATGKGREVACDMRTWKGTNK